MTTAYRFSRIVVLLWAGALVWVQSGEIKTAKADRDFWADVAARTARTAVVLWMQAKDDCRVVRRAQ